MPFFNIFSRKKAKENKKLKITADIREKNSLVISELISKGIDVEIKHLNVGDFLIGNTCIERKTASDFISSMINKRIFRQLEEIKQYKNYFLIIEGELNNIEFKNMNAVKGMLLCIITEFKVPILFSEDEEDTAEFLNLLAKKKPKEISLRVSRIFRNKKEQLQYILEGFPGIGPKTAKKLLEKYKTLRNIFKLNYKELEKEIGKKAESFKLLDEKY